MNSECPFCQARWLGVHLDAGDEITIPYLCKHQIGVDCESSFLLLEHAAIGLLQPTDAYGSPILTLNIELEDHEALIKSIRAEATLIDSSGLRFAVVEDLQHWIEMHRGPVPERAWPWPVYGPDVRRLEGWAQTYAWLDADLERVRGCGRFNETALCPSCNAPDVRVDPQAAEPANSVRCDSCDWRPGLYDEYSDVLIASPSEVIG